MTMPPGAAKDDLFLSQSHTRVQLGRSTRSNDRYENICWGDHPFTRLSDVRRDGIRGRGDGMSSRRSNAPYAAAELRE
jgi:hypothetical protein